jgi:TonB family protein
MAAYVAGVVLFGARLLGGVLLTRRALQNTRSIHSELWEHWELIANANVDLSLEESDCVRVPLTTGSDLMRVILPADWRAWPAEKRTAVLAHELAHARRRDPLVALVVAVNKCLFWFHPLAWWLERRLPVLAEHAADDAALSVSFDAQAYARLLLDNAARLDNGGSRLVWHSAMTGPVVAERIRRILDMRTAERLKPLGRLGWATLVSVGVTLIWISTAVDVPRLVAGQSSGIKAPWLLTAEQAAAMEQELATNPEDDATRRKLIQFYGFVNMCAGGRKLGLSGPPECSDSVALQGTDHRIPLILWLIDHHPESELVGGPSTMILPQLDPNGYEEARNHWLTQVGLHPNDARVLLNAANALGLDRPQEKLDLLQRARKLDLARATEPLASLYSVILISGNEPSLAAQVRSELQSSNDIALVGSVGQHVMEGGVSHLSASDRYALARELVTHAQSLEPENRDWADLMEGMKAMLADGTSPVAVKTAAAVGTIDAQTIRIGGTVAAANLQQSSPPIYPPLAKAAEVQGAVKLRILIGTDGHVRDTTVISGHPLWTNAAMDAAQQYFYKPTMLNGQAAQVMTDVEIVFRLPQP